VNLRLGHLTDAQIQEYLARSSGEPLNERQQSIDLHLSQCGRCLEIALQAQRAQLGFLEILPANGQPRADCPDEEIIMSLAAGDAPENVRDIIHHVAHCDFCGPLLKRCREDFSPEFTAEEETFLNELTTSGKQWQRQFVRDLTAVPPPGVLTRLFASVRQAMSPPRWRWVTAATAVVFLGVLGPIEGPGIMDKIQLAKAKKLAIMASSEQPVIEMRLPNSRYAPLHTEMGGSPASKSASWFEASTIVAKKKNAGRLDRAWLQVEGLTSLLEGTPGSASRAAIAFEKAHSEGLDDPTLEIERAASYFESKPPDVGKAIDLLRGVLKRPKLSQEERKVALFDLAIAYEGMESWRDAAQAWDDYLALDSSSDWAKDAKSRRDKAKSKIPEPKPLDQSPSSFLQSPALQFRVEEYQDVALESWLPLGVQEPKSAAGRAARKLAELLAEQHSDPFLNDLLNAASPGERHALEALGRAVRWNKTGWYGEAAQDAHEAATIFSLHRNVPGELLARFEEVYAAQQGLESSDCEAEALALQKKLLPTYHWLGAQVALERATCLNLAGDLAAAEKQLGVSRSLENKDFPVLRLRILGLSAGIKRLQNKDDESWQEAVEGLRLFGEGTYPWQRLYQFYSVMEQYAEKRHLLHAQQALLQQAIAIQEGAPAEDEDVILKGALYGRLSTVCLALKEDALAREALAKSNLRLARGASEPYAAKYVVYVKNGLAQAQLRLGSPQMAVDILEPARPLIDKIEHKFIALDFYKALGSSYRQLHRFDESASAYEEGIVIAEKNLASITDESARLKWMNDADPVYRGLALVLLEQGKDADALWLWEWYASRSAQVQRSPPRISWDNLQKVIFRPPPFRIPGPRLIYAVFEDRLQIWSANANGIKATPVKIKQSDLEGRINDFALECATPPTQHDSMDYLRKIGQPLGSLFLQPVLAELETARTITVELDPRLSRLPLIALILPNGHYFGQDYAITRSPGLLLETDLRAAESIRLDSSLLLAFGAPTTGEGRLPKQDQDEVKRTVHELFTKAKVKSAEQDSWIEVSRELKNHEVFVFFGHGVPEGTHTALVYGKVLLNANDFPPAILNRLRLAVVAACSSGVGGENPLQDTGTLVHAFISAGVPSVIVSRWNVDSERTAAILGSFFTHLGKNETIPQALYRARNESRASHERGQDYSHPYFWAGLELVGRSN
jgi:CHAT domain-containing protein